MRVTDFVRTMTAQATDRDRPHAVYISSDWPYPPTSGGRSHAAALVRHLGRRVDLSLLALDMPDPSPSWATAVAIAAGRRSMAGRRALDFGLAIATGTHVVLNRAEAAGLQVAFEEILRARPASLAVLGRPFLGSFIDIARGAGCRVVIDADESMSRVAASIARSRGPIKGRLRAALEWNSLERFEQREYPRADQVWVTSAVEKLGLVRYTDQDRIRVIPNVAPRAVADHVTAPEVSAVAFVGWYRYGPNEAAALELIQHVMPRIRKLGGPSHLKLVGRDPTPRMRAAARADADTEVTGEVPDVGSILRSAGILVCPIRAGGGTRVKILDAAALGVPVVSTSLGIEGLGFTDGYEALVADSPDSMARAVIRLSRDRSARQLLVEHAAEAVRHRWSDGAADVAIDDALEALGLLAR